MEKDSPGFQPATPQTSDGGARLRFALEEAGLATWETNFERRESIWSPNHFRLFGYPVDAAGRATLDMWSARLHPADRQRVLAELERGLKMVTNLPVISSTAAGWIGLQCTDEAMAIWLLRAILVENVSVRREENILYLPAGPHFLLHKEIKNVITVVAKTHHYWLEHLNGSSS